MDAEATAAAAAAANGTAERKCTGYAVDGTYDTGCCEDYGTTILQAFICFNPLVAHLSANSDSLSLSPSLSDFGH